MLVAETPELVAGLLLSSYPLHPPSNPARMRTEHLPKVNIPTLFVHGTRDPFGSIEQIEAARHLLPAKTQLLIVEGVGHDLGFSRKIAPNAKELRVRVLNSFLELVGLSAALPG